MPPLKISSPLLALPSNTALAVALPPLSTQLHYLTPFEIETAEKIPNKKSRENYLAGRIAAHKALEMLGAPTSLPIKTDPDSVPLWPEGVVGSISHSCSVGICLAAFEKDFNFVGVDIENYKRSVSPSFIEKMLKESSLLSAFRVFEEKEKAVLLFSAKEALFKGIFNALRIKVPFSKCVLTQLLSPNKLIFSVEIAQQPQEYAVAFTKWEDFFITAVVDKLTITN